MFKFSARNVVLTACAAFAVAGSAQASTLAGTAVTISGQNGDYTGTVTSSKLHKCADQRTVTVYKQKGAHQNPHVDSTIGSDTAELHGHRAVWSIGNSGFRSGKFYARVSSTPGCAVAASRTIHR